MCLEFCLIGLVLHRDSEMRVVVSVASAGGRGGEGS